MSYVSVRNSEIEPITFYPSVDIRSVKLCGKAFLIEIGISTPIYWNHRAIVLWVNIADIEIITGG
jgi:hypothetical protein